MPTLLLKLLRSHVVRSSSRRVYQSWLRQTNSHRSRFHCFSKIAWASVLYKIIMASEFSGALLFSEGLVNHLQEVISLKLYGFYDFCAIKCSISWISRGKSFESTIQPSSVTKISSSIRTPICSEAR